MTLLYQTRCSKRLLHKLTGEITPLTWRHWERQTNYRRALDAREQGMRMMRDGRAVAFKIMDGATLLEHWVRDPIRVARRLEIYVDHT